MYKKRIILSGLIIIIQISFLWTGYYFASKNLIFSGNTYIIYSSQEENLPATITIKGINNKSEEIIVKSNDTLNLKNHWIKELKIQSNCVHSKIKIKTINHSQIIEKSIVSGITILNNKNTQYHGCFLQLLISSFSWNGVNGIIMKAFWFFQLLFIIGVVYYNCISNNREVFNKRLKVSNLIFTSAIITMGFFILIKAACYTYPNAEDLSNAITSYNTENVFSTALLYLSLDSRFTTNLLYSFSPILFGGVEYYKLSAILYLILITFSIFFLFKQIFGFNFKAYKLIIAASAFSLIHFIVIPDITSDLFFMAASSVYLVSWIAVFFWIALFIKWTNVKTYYSKTISGALTLIVFLMSFGLNEMNIVINIFILVLLFYYVFKYKKQFKHELLILTIMFIATCLFIYMLPGTHSRIEVTGVSTDIESILESLRISGIVITKTLFKWTFTNAIYIPCIILSTLILYKYSHKKELIPFTTKEILVFFFMFICIIYISYAYFLFLTTYYRTNNIGLRALNYLNWAYQIIVLLILPILINRIIPSVVAKLYPYIQKIAFVSIIVISIFVITGKNNLNKIFIDDYSGDYSYFKAQMKKRYAVIYETKKKENWKLAVVDELKNIPRTLYAVPDLGYKKIKKVQNMDYSLYYNRFFGIDEIRLVNDSVTITDKLLNYE